MDWDKYAGIAWQGFLQTWSGLAVALLVYQLGLSSKALATRQLWRGTPDHPSWYDITLRLHPFVGGMLLGLIPFPTLRTIEDIGVGSWNPAEVIARVGWFMLWGGSCGQVYETISFGWWAIRRKIAIAEGARASSISDPPKREPSDPPKPGES